MRGIPVRPLRHSPGDWRARRDIDGLAVVRAGAAAGYGGDRRRPVTGGGEAAAPQRRDPRVNPDRLRRVTLAAPPFKCSRPALAAHGQAVQARRAEGAPLKP